MLSAKARIAQASTTIPSSTPPVTTLQDAAGPALKSHQRTSRHKSPEYPPPESPAYQTSKLVEYSQPELPASPPPKAEERLVISNTSETFSLWQRPPVHPLLKMFIFNYTNVDNFKDGIDDKLNVQEVGPYIYSETVEKVNIVFNDDSTLTFQENRTYQFLPEISAGSEDDLIKTPSIPLISADNELRKYQLNYFARFMVSATLRKIDPFRDLRVKDFLWGYDDPVYETAKTLAAFLNPLPYEKFGILVARNGLSEDRITMHTGVDDMSKLGIISRFNGIQELSHWGTAECNRIDGTDGTLYPVNQVSPNNTLHVFNHDLCRRFPLIFEKNVKTNEGIPALRFHAPRNVFDNPSTNPDNMCYCNEPSIPCLPAGVFNVSSCAFDSSNKPNLIKFLIDLWRIPIYKNKRQSIAMFIANEDKFWKVTSVEATEFTELACDHEETVTRLSLQTAHVGESNISSIVVHADDTDVLIILIGFIQQIKCQAYVRIGAPIMLSFPHFFLGDPVLTDIVNGLQPDPSKHDMYVDMHEKLGVPIRGQSRFQINIAVGKNPSISILENFGKEVILPIAWFELLLQVQQQLIAHIAHTFKSSSGWGLDELPDQIQDILYHVTFSAHKIQLALQPLPRISFVSATVAKKLIRGGGMNHLPHFTVPAPHNNDSATQQNTHLSKTAARNELTKSTQVRAATARGRGIVEHSGEFEK
uniref:Uncharacterized protein n=2 Tax=Timema TaxID=61471 RepID=A0A7R9AYW7_TIMSH|nr:unnamed protein product [Timema shepardi]